MSDEVRIVDMKQDVDAGDNILPGGLDGNSSREDVWRWAVSLLREGRNLRRREIEERLRKLREQANDLPRLRRIVVQLLRTNFGVAKDFNHTKQTGRITVSDDEVRAFRTEMGSRGDD